MEAKKLSKDRMKKYMARRKWQVMQWIGRQPADFPCLPFGGRGRELRSALLTKKHAPLGRKAVAGCSVKSLGCLILLPSPTKY